MVSLLVLIIVILLSFRAEFIRVFHLFSYMASAGTDCFAFGFRISKYETASRLYLALFFGDT